MLSKEEQCLDLSLASQLILKLFCLGGIPAHLDSNGVISVKVLSSEPLETRTGDV